MSIQQSPDEDPSRVNSRLNPKPTDFLADDIVLPHVTEGGGPTKAPEVFAIKDRNFAISIFMYADNPKRVDWINVEIFSKDGTSVAHYRTSVDVPEVISREVMRLYGESNRRQDPKNMLRETVSMFKQRFPVNWILTESSLTPPAEGAVPRFRPVIPTLNDFIVRPKIVDEHFTAVTSTQQGLERLTVKLFPHLGFMRCTVESDGISGYQREWKIKASLDGDLDLQFMNRDLLHKANELLVRLHLDGAEEVVHVLDRGHFDAYATPRFRTSVTQRDKRLARGHIDTPDRASVRGGIC